MNWFKSEFLVPTLYVGARNSLFFRRERLRMASRRLYVL
jgi:hypothetical protein